MRHLETETDCDGMLVHLVDHPYIDPVLVERMVEHFYDTKKLIVVPRWQGNAAIP